MCKRPLFVKQTFAAYVGFDLSVRTNNGLLSAAQTNGRVRGHWGVDELDLCIYIYKCLCMYSHAHGRERHSREKGIMGRARDPVSSARRNRCLARPSATSPSAKSSTPQARRSCLLHGSTPRMLHVTHGACHAVCGPSHHLLSCRNDAPVRLVARPICVSFFIIVVVNW